MSLFPVVALVVVDPAGNLQPVAPIRVEPDTLVLWIFVNQHANDDFKVEIADFKIKSTMTPALPVGGTHFRKLKPGEVDIVKEKVRPKGEFGDGKLPYTTYKYTVNVTDLTSGAAMVPYDPDLDIPPP